MFSPSRGGYALACIREAFVAWLSGCDSDRLAPLDDPELIEFHDAQMQSRWDGMTRYERAWWLTDQLWTCTDTVPGSTCETADLPRGSSYAQAARAMRALLHEDLEQSTTA
jgi:hypothetical protein